MGVKQANNVKSRPVSRLTTQMEELDWLYGGNKRPDGLWYWGLPFEKISLWAGQAGVGKSRLAITLARNVSRIRNVGHPQFPYFNVLYFQSEVDISTFKNWVESDGGKMPANLYLSDSDTLEEQVADIEKVNAHLVIVDSINMIEEFRNGSDSSLKKMIEGDSSGRGYRSVCKDNPRHIILLSQLTKDGKARGSSVLSHLVDAEFKLWASGLGEFYMKPTKNRYGKTGPNIKTWLAHREDGVEIIMHFRDEDELWCSTHNIPMRDLWEECRESREATDRELKKMDKRFFWLNILLRFSPNSVRRSVIKNLQEEVNFE